LVPLFCSVDCSEKCGGGVCECGVSRDFGGVYDPPEAHTTAPLKGGRGVASAHATKLRDSPRGAKAPLRRVAAQKTARRSSSPPSGARTPATWTKNPLKISKSPVKIFQSQITD